MKFKNKILLIVCMCVFQTHAQTYFNKLYDYGFPYLNAAGSSYEYANGDFLVSGQKYASSGFGAFHFIRININGDTVYMKKYPLIGRYPTTGTSGSLIKCFDGNLAHAYTMSYSSSQPDALLVKLTETGDTLWTKTYGGANFDNANIVHQTSDSGFVLMGVTQSFGMGGSDYYLIKTDKNGNFEWQRTYGTSGTEDCLSGDLTLDGGFILSGQKNGEFHIVKTDVLGNQQWSQTYSGTSGPCFIKQLADSTYILTGAKIISGFAGQAYIIKINKTGGIMWQNHYGSSAVDDWFYTRPIILSDGSMVVGGQQKLGSKAIGLLVKIDSIGNQQWLRTYYANATNNNYIYDVKLTSDNGFILVGSGNVTGQDAWVVKVDSVGCEIANCNVGVEENENDDLGFLIYPNPASSSITIESIKYQVQSIKIIDVLGREVFESTKNDVLSTKNIDVSQLPSGIYILQMQSKNGVVSKKFVKE